MNQPANVQRIGINNVLSHIQAFVNRSTNEGTRREYGRDVREFFQYFHGKDIERLTENDVLYTASGEEYSMSHAIEYREHLCNLDNSFSTVNRKMSVIKNLFEFLQGNKYQVNHLVFKLKRLKGNSEGYDSLTPDEAMEMSKYVSQLKFGDELEAFIVLSAVTSVRVSALLEADWTKVRYNKKENWHELKVIDKGEQMRIVTFRPMVYDLLIKCKQSEKLFHNLTVNYINGAMKKAAEAIGIDPNRRIVTHSLRSTAANFELDNGGSVKRAMDQTGHKSMNTFHQHYVANRIDHGSLAGMRMYEELDDSVFDNVDKERLLELLKDINVDVYNKLAQRVKSEVNR